MNVQHKILNRYFLSFCLLVLTLIACNAPSQSVRKVWLDSLEVKNIQQAAGSAISCRSMWNTPLIIAGDTFKRGIGTHASGMIRIALANGCTRFHAKVGIDDSAPENELKKATVIIHVYADGKKIWNSGLLKAGDKARSVDLDIKGIKQLNLYADATEDGIVGDRVDWVDVYINTNGESPHIVGRKHEEAVILTPPEPKVPHINPPYIFGARPGNPFLFTIPVSGVRPMIFSAKGLPEGIVLNKETGRLTGKTFKQGKFSVEVTAKNKLGTSSHLVTIVIGDTIALTPLMGWSGWNVFGKNITQDKIKSIAEAMVTTGLINYGYSYVNIDDGWQGKRGGKYYAIQPNSAFKNMPELISDIHRLGLKAGIYSSPWVTSYAGFTGGSADTPEGQVISAGKRFGKYNFSEQDVKQWQAWGIDYLKYDWNPIDTFHTEYMSDMLINSGRDIVYSISNAAPYELATRWSEMSNLWRTTMDVQDNWYSIVSIGFSQNKWQAFAGPGHWNDPDMLVVGKVGWGNIRPTRLSPNEQYSHISLWSLLAAPLIIGCDLTDIDNFTLKLLTNTEVIAVDQDMLGIQGYCLNKDTIANTQVWVKPLADHSWAVGLFNLDEIERQVKLVFKDLNLNGDILVRDLWRQKDQGIFNKSFVSKIPVHGVLLIRLTAKDLN